MDKLAVMDALDRAIAETVQDEFRRLTMNKAGQEVNELLDHARREVFKLNEGRMPDYDGEMVAAAYVAAYQLQHINLTYSLIKDILGYRPFMNSALSRNGRLHVVDFGCGALAMQFGLTLAVADALEANQDVTAIHVDSMDTSVPMMVMGDEVWKRFKHITAADNSDRLRSVNKACQLVSYESHNSIDKIRKVEESESWLSAIHAVYSDTERLVKQDLAELYRRLSPTAGFITCYGNHEPQFLKGNIDIVRRVSPFDHNKYEQRLLSGYIRREGVVTDLALPIQLDKGSYSSSVRRVTDINREWGLIDSAGTQRTDTAVLNWTYDTAFFTYIDATYIDDLDDLPF